MTTNVPQPTFGSAGFIAPAQSAILAGVQADINAAFGGNLNYSLSTPQGQIASSESSIIGNTYDMFVFYTTQTDPAYATGRMQDAIGRLYNMERIPSAPTVLQLSCSGLPGLTIPVGALVADGNGNQYACTGSGIITPSGSVTLSFSGTVPGPVPVPTSVSIYQAVPGWDSASVISGVVGQNVESRGAFEARRQQQLAANSAGSLPSILGEILDVTGVTDAFVTENTLSVPITLRGVTLAANSLYAAVVGGTAANVAAAIWRKKGPGCNYNGNTTVTVFDTNPSYTPPYPSYQVTFEIPTDLPIYFDVTVADSTAVPSNSLQLIQNAIVSAFAGGDGGPRARIASVLYALRYVPPVAALGPWAQVISIGLSTINTPTASIVGSISGTTLTVTSVAFGVIEVGVFIADGSGLVQPGTLVTEFLTGVGGTGTYKLSTTQTISSRTLEVILASSNLVEVNYNQEPTIDPNNVTLTLI